MQKEKSIGRNILIVVLILVTIASVCAGLFAWAKYQTTINGTATGETAKWSFKVSDGDTSTQEIDFPMTRKDNNTSVAEGKLAPGTYGELEIGIDATGTETSLTYVIEATMQNKPTNMKFYSDAERTLELTILDNKFSKGGYMKLNEAGARTETIYWEWPFETGTTASQIEANDNIDTQDSSKTMSMQVSVTGKQVNKNPVLADLVQVGDYVNYDASSNGPKTFTSDDCLSGTSISDTISTENSFSTTEIAQWRVLNVDRTNGVVELMAVNPTTQLITLYKEAGNNEDITGFSNSIDMLNSVGAIYGQGKGADYGRSFKLDDVEKFSSYDKTKYVNTDKSTYSYSYNDTHEYTAGTVFHKENKDVDENVIGYDKAITNEFPITLTQTSYWYFAKNYIKEDVHNMIFKDNSNLDKYKRRYWLANQCVNLYPGFVHYSVFHIVDGKVGAALIYDSKDRSEVVPYYFMPVVVLDKNLKTTGQDANGVWQLDV
ncbi:MAG: hypothetical protein E7313_01755 [Clostridiales bacterium]|nr:hypothetical protein [Clostridiales bacterium]